MMKTFFNKFYLGLFLLSAGAIYAQDGRIGINTTDPKTTLDVSGKTDTSGNVLVADMTGLQAPRITLADLSAKGDIYGIDQRGAIIYITDITGGNTTTQRVNIQSIGYYFFDGSVWFPIKPEPWYNVATNTEATANTQDIYQMERVGIGTSFPAYQLDVLGEIKGERFIGFGAGNISSNTAVGEGSLASNTTGINNVTAGNQALNKNTTGSSNVALGYRSLVGNTIGSDNVALGHETLRTNTTGSRNVAIGGYNLSSNTSGADNLVVGSSAFDDNTTGQQNVVIGNGSAGYSTTNSFNTVINGNFQSTNLADFNTAYGYKAASEFTTGNRNTFLGVGEVPVGNDLYNGSNNIIIGARVVVPPVAFNNNIVLADGAGNRRINVDANGNVGINSNTPSTVSKLQVVGIPVYADDAAAAAGGLTSGAFYSSADGILRVKL